MNEYRWVAHHIQEIGTAAGYRLAKPRGRMFSDDLAGYLKKGSKKRQGWFVHTPQIAVEPIVRLPHTLTESEAQDAAKLILLSLKESQS